MNRSFVRFRGDEGSAEQIKAGRQAVRHHHGREVGGRWCRNLISPEELTTRSRRFLASPYDFDRFAYSTTTRINRFRKQCCSLFGRRRRRLLSSSLCTIRDRHRYYLSIHPQRRPGRQTETCEQRDLVILVHAIHYSIFYHRYECIDILEQTLLLERTNEQAAEFAERTERQRKQ